MNIVVLDGYAANPGDLCWDELQALGECTIYDRTAPAEVLERAAGAEILLTNKTVLTAEHMAALPELKYIGVLATGYNIVDTAAAKERGIIVTNIPAYMHTGNTRGIMLKRVTRWTSGWRVLRRCWSNRELMRWNF